MHKLLMVATIPGTLTGFLKPFVQHFRAQGWLVDGMACGISASSDCLEMFDHVWDVEWSRNPLDPSNLMKAPHTIRNVMDQGQYDIVHVHTPVASLVTRYSLNNLRKHNKVNVIYTAHGFHFHPGGKLVKNTVFIALEKLAGAWTDYLVVINRDDEQAAKRYQIVPPERVRYMPGIGVDINSYNRNKVAKADITQVRQELGLTPTNYLFLAIAEFTPNKRHKDMVRALAQLRRPDVHLAFAGEGPQTLVDDIHKLVIDLGVENQVHFLGHRRDVSTLICTSVATLLTSEREGLPRSIMEALCLEIPVIGTAIRGIRDLLADDCGILVNVGDVNALADAMTWILDHPQAARKMGERGRVRMAEYDLHHIIDLHEALYAEAFVPYLRGKHYMSGAFSQFLKTIADRSFALLLLGLLSPVILVITIAVYIRMGGPVVFTQPRPGKHGRVFKFYKFRTMTSECDADGNLLPDEQRLTAFGLFLRKTSLDEIPQLWNILKGDMSFVGPRPLLVRYLNRYTPEQARRHEVIPGITGWAQVHGRRLLDGCWEEKFKFDIWYVDHWSLWLDLKILFMTVLTVLKQEGITQEGHVTGDEFKGSATEK
jgi:lipopolysaccharide/colanic/teichoic acid biosynthesis glycosyltransferase/glycosyltransferase involved in cell wall biosynthesis